MAIAHPFDLDVKAFSAAYGGFHHSVNASETAETRLKDFEQSALCPRFPGADCAAAGLDDILPETTVKAFSDS